MAFLRVLLAWGSLGLSVSCTHYQKLSSHNRILVASGTGVITSYLLVGPHPLIMVYMLAGGGVLGTAVAVHELSQTSAVTAQQGENWPRVPEIYIRKGTLVDQGEGRLNLPGLSDEGQKVRWNLYDGQFWIKNKGNQFLFVDKVIEFEAL